MKNQQLSLLAALYFLTAISAQAQEWKPVKNTDGIQVYTRTVEGTSVKSYKAQAQINAPVSAVHFIYTDLESYKKIMEDLAEIELLQNTNNEKYIIYSKMNMPWPVEDRDMVTETNIEKNNGKISIKSKALNNKVEPKDGFVRIENYWEIITLTPVEKEKVEIQIEGLFDMGGSLPAWVTNMYLIDGPIGIIKNIRKQVE